MPNPNLVACRCFFRFGMENMTMPSEREAAPQGASQTEGSKAVSELPSYVRVGPFDFKIVRWTLTRASVERVYGSCSCVEQEIRIQESFVQPVKAVDTFMHECLHAIMWAWDITGKDEEERIVGRMATALVTLYVDNPWLAPWIARHARSLSMPGAGSRFTPKEDRQAQHVAKSLKKAHSGMSAKRAKSAGYATVNKQKGKKGGK